MQKSLANLRKKSGTHNWGAAADLEDAQTQI